jgi:hypothetical protein
MAEPIITALFIILCCGILFNLLCLVSFLTTQKKYLVLVLKVELIVFVLKKLVPCVSNVRFIKFFSCLDHHNILLAG